MLYHHVYEALYNMSRWSRPVVTDDKFAFTVPVKQKLFTNKLASLKQTYLQNCSEKSTTFISE